MQITHIFHVLLAIIFLHRTTEAYYKAVERTAHSAVYYDDKIYFIGGEVDGGLHTKDFFYLDLKINFNTNDQNSIPYFDLTNTSVNILPHKGGTSSMCGENKDTLVLWSGDTAPDLSGPLIYTFSMKEQAWTYPNNIAGNNPPRRRRINSACDDKGKMYLYGGSVDDDMGTLKVFNNTDILDTVKFEWESMSTTNSPGPNNFYTATLLPTGDIVYIGGWTGLTVTDTDFISLTNVTLYNVNSNTWSLMTTVGDIPSSGRDGHAAVLTRDGRIIVSGGEYPHQTAAQQRILVLDTTVSPYKWTIPTINTPSSFPCFEHTATLYDDYMIVAFGVCYDGNVPIRNREIHILDVSDYTNYTWVTSYVSKFPQPVSTKQNKQNIGIIIGPIIGGLVLFGVAAFLVYKWYQRKKEFRKAIPTGSESYGETY